MATEPTYTLRRATVDDVPGMVDVWYHAFNAPEIFTVFPNTPAGGAWVGESLSRGIREEFHNTTSLVVVKDDPVANTKTTVAFARYVLHEGKMHVPEWRERWVAKMGPGMNEELVGPGFFEPMADQHAVIVEHRPHICRFSESYHVLLDC